MKEHKHEHTTEKKEEIKINTELEETKVKLLRALADFDNFRKRAVLEKDEMYKYGNENLIRELLPVLDGFAKAVEHAGSENKEELIKGIALIRKQMEDVFKKYGVSAVEALGNKFDPNFHEAILMQESDKENGTIVEEMQKGYTMNGRLLRPSMVIVSKEKA